MICRDNRKDTLYFQEYIAEQEKRIKRFQEAKCNLTDENSLKECSMYLSSMLKDMFSAKYSAGYSKDELLIVFDEYLNEVMNTDDLSYEEYINIISIDVLLDAGKKDLIKNLDLSYVSDALTEFLLLGSTNRSDLRFEGYYAIFYSFANGNTSEAEFYEYIKKDWYSNSKECAWYASLDNENDTYVGYWCWLAAALIKEKGLNVPSDIEYIPII